MRKGVTMPKVYNDVDYFDCSETPDGMHTHPTDPTRYIHCHNGRATDKVKPECADCDSGFMQLNTAAHTFEHNH